MGSIILAGVLLKLGGFGIILVERNLWAEKRWIWGGLLRLTLVGVSLIRIRITRFADIKVIIAHSSVIHIAIVAAVFIRIRKLGTLGGILTIIAHGFTSSGLFIIANSIYDRSHSRRIIVNKGLVRIDSSFTLVWFILLVLNFARQVNVVVNGGARRKLKFKFIKICFLIHDYVAKGSYEDVTITIIRPRIPLAYFKCSSIKKIIGKI